MGSGRERVSEYRGVWLVESGNRRNYYSYLVNREPCRNIDDLTRIRAVFLNGREIDRAALRRAMLARSDADGSVHGGAPAGRFRGRRRPQPHRYALGQHDRPGSRPRANELAALRRPGDHALTVLARIGEKDAPLAAVVLPLSRGAVAPVDLSAYTAIEFDARGEGPYSLLLAQRTARGRDGALPFTAAPEWGKVRVALPGKVADALALEFRIERKAGQGAWLQTGQSPAGEVKAE